MEINYGGIIKLNKFSIKGYARNWYSLCIGYWIDT